MLSIEIVKVPEGEAPEPIKREWVGVQMTATKIANATGARGVLSHELVAVRGISYAVRLKEALRALRAAQKKEAVTFWSNLRLAPGDRLLFRADECRELASA